MRRGASARSGLDAQLATGVPDPLVEQAQAEVDPGLTLGGELEVTIAVVATVQPPQPETGLTPPLGRIGDESRMKAFRSAI